MREISRLSVAMGLLRQRVHREMPLQHIVLLLAVSEQPGITMPELMRLLDMPQGTVSRNVKTLATYVERMDGVAVLKGYDLLRTQPDGTNRRVLAVYLTSRGEALIHDLARVLRLGQERDGLLEAAVKFDYPGASVREMVAQ